MHTYHNSCGRYTETMYFTVSIACFVCLFLQSVLSLQSCQHLTCHDCIKDPVQCAWCSGGNLQPDKRCQPAALSASWCLGDVENPTSDVIAADDQDFSSDMDHIIQLKPQRIHIKLRVGVQTPFQFSFKAAKNYPVDLYFLIDASNSMKEVRDVVLQKSKEIYDVMKKLTENISLGLGAFIERKRTPFAQKVVGANCYSFKHVSSLGSSLSKFDDELTKLEFGFNFDMPESGLDALAQVMSCEEKIGWRPTSRKIIIYLTDADLHVAGDGKMSGIVNPYDGKCYLNEDGFYFKENEMDYPSISVISKLAAAEQFTIIFFNECNGEKCDVPVVYAALVKRLSRAVYVPSTNVSISEKLQDLYKKITTNLLLNTKIPPEYQKYFEIKFHPDCTGGADCKVHIGEEIHVEGTIQLNNYYGKDHEKISIEQQALKECLKLDVDIVSSCGCEDRLPSSATNSFECSAAGSRQCGICVCNEGRSGPLCACSDTPVSSTSLITKLENDTCIRDGDGVECSNNGKCVCGRCKCSNPHRFGGYYCEYRTDNCKIDPITKMLCSGHGQCEDGQCHCDDGWEGELCDCPLSQSICKDDDGIECNSRGHCECGKCKCNKYPGWDVRKYGINCERELCEDCNRKQCQRLVPCVSCAGANCPEDCLDKLTFLNNTDLIRNWSVCANVQVAIGCYNNFSYAYDSDAILLLVTSKPNCVESYYIYGGISLLVLLAVGVATLVAWKLMADARDRAEFRQFLQQAAGEDEETLNQCYTAPTTTYQNPMFKKSSFRKYSDDF